MVIQHALSTINPAYQKWITTSYQQFALERMEGIQEQFQVIKHFLIRAEAGFLGSRKYRMSGIQYRFGL